MRHRPPLLPDYIATQPKWKIRELMGTPPDDPLANLTVLAYCLAATLERLPREPASWPEARHIGSHCCDGYILNVHATIIRKEHNPDDPSTRTN